MAKGFADRADLVITARRIETEALVKKFVKWAFVVYQLMTLQILIMSMQLQRKLKRIW